ncbi:replication initiation protein [Paraburkholderia kururiensis]|uniref:replication initiation protein n=2 Tax=Paraburkholderia kururiensis TaxID=984307 RepID=UPI0018F74625|nr:replication initiation protein [Paraburkholderia kururiensis]
MSQITVPSVAEQDKQLVERHVNMSNVLVRAAQGLSLAEKRIMSACIAKLDSKRLPDPTRPLVTRMSASEFAETFGIDTNTAYDELQAGAKSLRERLIRYEKPGRKGPQIVEMRWVGRITYAKGEGWLELSFWHEVVPHLIALRDRFTSYKLSHAAALRSVYSWRLLELLSQFKGTGLLRIGIDEFTHAMDAPISCRANFKDLRRRVIEPAVQELIEKDGFLIAWEAKKSGRKVTGLEFRFDTNPQTSLF